MRRGVGFLVAFLFPGAGHMALGRTRRGAIWFALGLVPFLLLFPLGAWALALLLAVRLAAMADTLAVRVTAEPSWGSIGIKWAELLAITLVVTAPVRMFLVEAFKIPSGGMLPTLEVGDHIFVHKWRAKEMPGRGELVVFVYPQDPSKVFVKRAVAIAGDTVQLRGGHLVVNGQPAARKVLEGDHRVVDFDDMTGEWTERSFVLVEEALGDHRYTILEDPEQRSWHMRYGGDEPYQVPPGTFFVLGDHRSNSHDSRYWGPVPVANALGRPDQVWWSQGPTGVRWERFGLRLR